MEQGRTQHPGRYNRHSQVGQRALNAVASGSSYQGPSRCRWYHPDSYSSNGKEHLRSGFQKACSSANSIRSRGIRITSDRDERGWEFKQHYTSLTLTGTLSTGGGCYVWRFAALTRPHTAVKMVARCLYILTAYPQYSQVPSINFRDFLVKVFKTKQISFYRIILKSLLFTTGWHGNVGFSHVWCFPLATLLG